MAAPHPPSRTAADPAPGASPAPAELKRSLRNGAVSARRILDETSRRTGDEARTDRVIDLVTARWPDPGAVIACYLSQSPEPDTLALVSALHAMGHRLLAPILSRRAGLGSPRPIAWGWYEGPTSLTSGLRRIPEPTSAVLGSDVLQQADLVITSGLVGGLDGSRVGTGGGWFDRALTHLRPGAPVWLLLNDSEVLDSLPQESHDHRVTLLVTPTRSLTTRVVRE